MLRCARRTAGAQSEESIVGAQTTTYYNGAKRCTEICPMGPRYYDWQCNSPHHTIKGHNRTTVTYPQDSINAAVSVTHAEADRACNGCMKNTAKSTGCLHGCMRTGRLNYNAAASERDEP